MGNAKEDKSKVNFLGQLYLTRAVHLPLWSVQTHTFRYIFRHFVSMVGKITYEISPLKDSVALGNCDFNEAVHLDR